MWIWEGISIKRAAFLISCLALLVAAVISTYYFLNSCHNFLKNNLIDGEIIKITFLTNNDESIEIEDEDVIDSLVKSVNQCPRDSTHEWGLESPDGKMILLKKNNNKITIDYYINSAGEYDFHFNNTYIYSNFALNESWQYRFFYLTYRRKYANAMDSLENWPISNFHYSISSHYLNLKGDLGKLTM